MAKKKQGAFTAQINGKTITITNNGNQNFTPSIDATNLAAPFTLSSYTGGAIAPGESKTVTLTYAPTASGNYSGSFVVTIGDNATTVNVSGSAIQQTIAGSVTPSTFTFANKTVGQSYTGLITITNIGTEKFTPTVNTSGVSAPFSVSNTTIGELEVDESATITVTYAPTAAGNHSSSFTVTIGETTHTVTLNGSAIVLATSTYDTGNDGTGSSNFTRIAPMFVGDYSSYPGQSSEGNKVQTFYPASMLMSLANKQITKMTFYLTESASNTGKMSFSIGETDATDISTMVSEDNLKVVAEIDQSTITGTTVEVTFDRPYIYTGKNLVIQTKVTEKYSGSLTSRNPYKFRKKTISGTQVVNKGSLNTPNTSTPYSVNDLPQALITYSDLPALTVTPEDGVLAFAQTSTTGSRTLNITITNNSTNDIAAPSLAWSGDNVFSTTYAPAVIPAGATITIPVRFAPTAATTYTGTVTVTVNGDMYPFNLFGSGRENGSTMNENDFQNITYNWTDSEGNHTNNLAEIATTPEQMIALMKKVYTDTSIPGNIYRGHTASGVLEDDLVSYPGIGNGWDISAGTVEVGGTSYSDPTAYVPEKEGLTVLLVEMNDSAVAVQRAIEKGLPTTISGNSTYQTTSTYSDLVNQFYVMFKSVRVLTSSKIMGAGNDGGTLFKIDCDQMNRFFLLAKGRLRTANDKNKRYYASDNEHHYQVVDNSSINMGPFYRMFEQFSPNIAAQTSSAMTDIYRLLVNMEEFDVIHDCVSIPSIGGHHEFNLYGVTSDSEDCQDVRDMMFFIPEHRMTYFYDRTEGLYRDPRDHDHETGALTEDTDEKYENYNPDIAPKMGLFVIRQFPITGEQISGQNVYKLHLTWTSNLLDFLPGEDGMYTLYRVSYNAQGQKVYTEVAQLDPNTYEYYDNVDMQKNGQQVTYVVRGQDKEKFLTLQYSNEEDFVIPGYDKAEQLRLALNTDYYFSRFDPNLEVNNYSNSLIISNNIGTNVKASYLQNGSEFKFMRGVYNPATNAVDNAVEFAKATVSNMSNGSGNLTISFTDTEDVKQSVFKFGYHANTANPTFTYASSDSEVQFNDFWLYDNFSVSVAENTHPGNYVYYVTLETATPFAMDDNNLNSYIPAEAKWIDGKTFIYVEGYDTWTNMKIWAWNADSTITPGNYPGNTLLTEASFTNNGHKVWIWEVDESTAPTGFKFIWNYYDQQQESTDFTIFVNGGYYVISNDNYGYKGVVGSTAARSNTVIIPIYKTAMDMNSFTASDVEGDTKHELPIETNFSINVQHSSKTEILRYDAYRWADRIYDGSSTARTRTIIDLNSPADDEQDIAPNAEADNQDVAYTTKVNGVATGESYAIEAGQTIDVPFADNFISKQTDAPDTYTYAPVVELFAPTSDRDDYNTYGGPLQMSAGGVIKIIPGSVVGSNNTFKPKYFADETNLVNGTDTATCCYYFIPLTLEVNIPDGYEIYKVRAWRLADTKWLGEVKDGYQGRINSDYLYQTIDEPDKNENVYVGVYDPDIPGSTDATVQFGAKKLGTGESFDVDFIVRAYFTKKATSKLTSADGKYYIAESKVKVTVTDEIITGIFDVKGEKQVAGVKYYNVAGMESDRPFNGVNIVVTRYTDGSISTSKVLK